MIIGFVQYQHSSVQLVLKKSHPLDENAGIVSFLNLSAQLRSQDLPNMARDRQEDLSSATVLVYNLASGKAINSRFFGYCRLMNVEYG